jgi:iron complex transport system ATP-binding protein
LKPERGSIELFGTDVGALSQSAMARLVAFVPQEQQQVFPFTVLETVLMGR